MMEKTEALFCIGCGAKIQTTDENSAGYTQPSVLQQGIESGEIYCKRCFRLRNYNEIQDVNIEDDEFLKLLNEVGQSDSLIVNVIDIFDFNGSLIPGLNRFAGKNPILMIANKRDILPKSLKDGKIRQWLMESAHQAGLKPIDVLLISAKKKHEMERVVALLEKYRQGKDVYVVGVTNVGKSTLINQIINYTTGEDNLITTSRFPGTTLDKIEIPLSDGHFIYDTPGIIHRHQMAHLLGAKDLRIIAPQKEIKPKTYQLNAEQSLFMGGLARFDFVQGERQSFTAYFANDLNIHRTKLAKANQFYQQHLGGLLQPPRKEEVADFPELVRHEFSIKEKSDIVFSGLGWISVKSKAIIHAWVPKGVSVVIRKALI
ncbi:MAG: ribosome biogenesis GTPase YqeH [Streptococcaceae bacterium]|jgi:ribosome biogenesis GTPase YqeH|nr:ribosome biogenesis GTPase YqeH [Streptococcaceae bacterium]